MRNVATVAGVELRLFLRDRANIFFAFIFPLLLVLMIGAQFGVGATTGRVAVSEGGDSALGAALVTGLESEDVEVSDPGWEAALQQLARGRIDVAVRVDDAAQAAHESGEGVALTMVRGSSPNAQVVEQEVRSAIANIQAARGQGAALEGYGVPADRAAAALATAQQELSEPVLEVIDVDELSEEFEGLGQFDLGASGQLLLFVFLSTLAGAATLIQARRLGVISRMLAGPISTTQLIAGETLGRWMIGLFQGGYIMVATSLLFGVSWGNLWLSLLVLAIFALVASGAAILLGTLLENPGAAGGVGIGLGLVLAALGGAMLPLELFPDTMRSVAHLTPHAWAYDAFAEIQRRGGGLLDIWPQLGVLAGMALLLLALGAWSLRRSLSRAM
ncbi:ABC transporter permease [Nocardioides sp. zg-578]|nr:ABC transporter permease [Nocardioides marmotae]MTB83114.1 ABC transporter permease subunit [Nocardioides marmotae]